MDPWEDSLCALFTSWPFLFYSVLRKAGGLQTLKARAGMMRKKKREETVDDGDAATEPTVKQIKELYLHFLHIHFSIQ